MNIPNIISVFRLTLIPVFLKIFHSNIENNLLWSGLIFLIAGISDVVDGYIARKYNMTSKLGAVLDPLADKLMIFTVMASFAYGGLIPFWILILLTIKELLLIIGGSSLYLKKENIVIPWNTYGKLATLSFYVAVFSIVFDLSTKVSSTLFIVTVAMNIIAFLNYFKIYVDIRKS